MFGLFKKKKTETKVKVVHNQYADQRGARAKGDIVGGNKYSTYAPAPAQDPLTDLMHPLNPFNPLSPFNTMKMDQSEVTTSLKHHHTSSHSSGSDWSSHSHDSGSSYSSHDSSNSSSSSSYDSGSSSSYDSGSSFDSSFY